MSYVSVIGGGSWGTTLAKLLAEKNYDVSQWVFEPELAEEINKTGINSIYLPGITLPDNIKVYSDIGKAVEGSRYIVNAVPTQHARKILTDAVRYIDKKDAIIINASKGIEISSFKTISMIVKDICAFKAAALSGPSFAAEVVKKLPTAVTVASDDYDVCLHVQEMFNTDYFRVYTHHDIVGVELGGALKNVIAVAAGISEGLGLGNSAKSALITRGLAEMTRFGVMLGAKEHTFSGLSGIGDLVLTCNSHLSRNFTVGYRMGQGQKLADITSGTKSIAEGVYTAKAAHELAKKMNVDLPIIDQIYNVIHEGKDPRQAVNDLMSRALKAEFYA